MSKPIMIGEHMSGTLLSLERYENGLMSRPYYLAVVEHQAVGGRYLVIRFKGDEELCMALDLRQLPGKVAPLTGFQFTAGIDSEILKIDPDFLE